MQLIKNQFYFWPNHLNTTMMICALFLSVHVFIESTGGGGK